MTSVRPALSFSEKEIEATSNPDYWVDRNVTERIYPGKDEDLNQLAWNELKKLESALDLLPLSSFAVVNFQRESTPSIFEKSFLPLLKMLAGINKKVTVRDRLAISRRTESLPIYDPNEDFVDPAPIEVSSIKIEITDIIEDPDFD